jgi:hypothetical protein
MMKLTARQLSDLFGVDRGRELYLAINPLYGLNLGLAQLTEVAIKKMLNPTKYYGPSYVEILSLQETERWIDFLEERKIKSSMTVSVNKHYGVSEGDGSFDRAFGVVYGLLEIKFPAGGVFEKISVGESNLWKLSKASFKNSLRNLLHHTCYFKFKDNRKWYVEEENKKARMIVDLFLAGGFYVGYYPTSSFRIEPNTVLVLVK